MLEIAVVVPTLMLAATIVLLVHAARRSRQWRETVDELRRTVDGLDYSNRMLREENRLLRLWRGTFEARSPDGSRISGVIARPEPTTG